MAAFRTSYKQLTGSGQVLAGEGWIAGYHCNATSSGTISLYDALTATGTAIWLDTPAAGKDGIMNGMHFTTGCYCTVGGTSLNITFEVVEQVN